MPQHTTLSAWLLAALLAESSALFAAPSVGRASAAAGALDAESVEAEAEAEMQELGVKIVPTYLEKKFGSKGAASEGSTKRRSKPMMWVHLHKSGGSMMCSMAKRNHETVVTPGESCMWLNHDLFWDSPQYQGASFPPPTCAERKEHLQRNPFTWAQIERVFTEQDYCPETFTYGIMLRDPMHLALSMTNAAAAGSPVPDHSKDFQKVMYCVGTHAKNNPLCSLPEEPYGIRLWMFYDNFVVRTLGGMDVYRLPPGGVTEQHARRVIKLLESFDMVMFLEDINRPARLHLADRLGWGQTLAPLSSESGPAMNGSIPMLVAKKGVTGTFTNQQYMFLANQNQWDQMVYDHFRRSKKKTSTGLM